MTIDKLRNSKGEIFILVADDDADDHEFLKSAFAYNSFSGGLSFVTDGVQLLDYLKNLSSSATEELPQLILLDLNMPLLNGFQALEAIKEDPALSDIPVAILTSSSRPEDEAMCYSLGCDNFYRKPLSVAEYHSLAERIIGSVNAA